MSSKTFDEARQKLLDRLTQLRHGQPSFAAWIRTDEGWQNVCSRATANECKEFLFKNGYESDHECRVLPTGQQPEGESA